MSAPPPKVRSEPPLRVQYGTVPAAVPDPIDKDGRLQLNGLVNVISKIQLGGRNGGKNIVPVFVAGPLPGPMGRMIAQTLQRVWDEANTPKPADDSRPQAEGGGVGPDSPADAGPALPDHKKEKMQ